ncbi:hypothetical protein Tco_0388666 [Tanacetum coccineum]
MKSLKEGPFQMGRLDGYYCWNEGAVSTRVIQKDIYSIIYHYTDVQKTFGKREDDFGSGKQVTNVDDDVDDSPEIDLALNVDHVFEADECDAFDFDADEGPTTQTMFIANLTSEDLIYDEPGSSHTRIIRLRYKIHDIL